MKASVSVAFFFGRSAGVSLHQLQSLEVLSNTSGGTATDLAAQDAETGPSWLLRSSRTGPVTEPCGTTFTQSSMDACSEDDITQYRSISEVFQTNPGGIRDLSAKYVMLGSGGPKGLLRCIHHNIATRDAEHPISLIVDAQYENYPRCCRLDAMDGLMTNKGEYTAWAMEAAQNWERLSFRNISYVQVAPSEEVCNEQNRCPLVVQIAGGGELVDTIGDPWLLVQSACDECRVSLRATLIAPEMTQDILGPGGLTLGTSSHLLRHTLVPLVADIIHNSSQVDDAKVYILAQSRGVDTGLRAALQHPDIFTMAVLSGMFIVTDDTKDLINSNVLSQPDLRDRKLTSIQFHLGDLDHCFPPKEFYTNFTSTLAALGKQLNVPRLDVRVYPDSAHSVWYAAWNSLHEVIWTNRDAPRQTNTVSLSCKAKE